MPTISYTAQLVTVTCWCGIEHAIPSDLNDYALRKKHDVYCPLGHVWVYTKTTAELLREKDDQIERERRRFAATRELLAHEEGSHAATRGHVTRMKKRVAKGICPSCKRSFENLRRHMDCKHPEYANSTDVEATASPH